MLLDFKFKNFKSFKDEADFFMTAAPKQQGLNYSLTEIIPKVRGRKKTIKALCSSVIYGANAAGKTNIFTFNCISKFSMQENRERKKP